MVDYTLHRPASVKGRAKRLIGKVFRRIVANKYMRIVCAYYLYRGWIAHSEAAVMLRRKEEKLDESYWMCKLRHYAHIIDKGLQRPDSITGHGAGGYRQAKDALAHIKSDQGIHDPSVSWAVQKLRQYEQFQAGEPFEPMKSWHETACKYDDLLNVIMTRRSIRCYMNRPVENEVIEKITDVLDWSPTSCNRQPGRVYASNDPETVRRCVSLHAGAACFTNIYAPLFLTFCADSREYEMPMEVAMPHVDVALGVQNCVLAAHTLGVSLTLLTCTYLPGQRERELRSILEIPPHFQIIVSAVGGFPKGHVQTPARKRKELFIVSRQSCL